MRRRDILKLAGLFVDPAAPWPVLPATNAKRVIVAGGGIAGLVCAYELTRRAHDVVLLEASSRTGGHVRTVREGLSDGLYADGGAEHFTQPGYDLCWAYIKDFNLPFLAYPHRENMLRMADGRMMAEEEARAFDQSRRAGVAMNQRELDYLRKNPSEPLSLLYLDRYIEKIKDEYQPFGVGLDDLDGLSLRELLLRDGASEAVVARYGAGASALHSIWKMAILRLRKVPSRPRQLFRLQGGNQALPDALAQRLGDRIHLDSAVGGIRHDDRGVSVTCRRNGRETTVKGDYLVCCMNAIVLRRIPVQPAWPESKHAPIANMPYTVETRFIFQSRSKFWKRDHYSGNMDFNATALESLWPMAEEVHTERGILIGKAQGGVPAASALSVFQQYYPGKSADIERHLAVDWSRDPWAMACEARNYQPGELRKFWPAVIEPVGRVYFAGAYCDNQSWGMEAASRSAYRVARAIHDA